MGSKAVAVPGPWSLPRPGRRFSLLGKFSLLSFLLLLAIGGALAWGIQAQLEQSALSQAADSAADQVKLLLGPRVWADNLRDPASLKRQIDDLVHKGLLGSHIV